MEEYDQEFLTFTVKDEPQDSEDEFIGFEEISSFDGVYKRFVVIRDSEDHKSKHKALLKLADVKKRKVLAIAAKKEAVKDLLVKKRCLVDVKHEPIQPSVYVKESKSKKRTTDTEVDIPEIKNIKLVRFDKETGKAIALIDNNLIKYEGSRPIPVYLCDICGAKYTRKSKLRTHILNHVVKGPNELPLCEYCGEVFDSIDKFFCHFDKIHHTNAEDVLITFKEVKHVLCCEYCGNAYAYPESLNKHRGVHSGKTKPYSCQFCDTLFDAYSKLVTHSLKHNKIKTDYPVDRYWLCDFNGCVKALKNITSLNYHKKNVHQKKYMSQCKKCTETFENSWSLHNHMQVKHLGPFPCPVCERSCPTTKLLKRHMLTHLKNESTLPNQSRRFVNYCKYLQVDAGGQITCKECQQAFDTRKRFRTHVVEYHDKSKNFFCEYCDKGFTLAWQLNSHVESTHTKKFQCNICGVYKNKHSKLVQHMKTHEFPCHCCEKSFSRQQYLDSHIKKRHISKLICGNYEQKVLNKCEYVDSNGIRRPQPTKIYVMPGPSADGSNGTQTPIRTINVNINQSFVEPKIKKLSTTSSAKYNTSSEINDQQNLESLAAIAFLESEMSQAAKMLTMPFINK